MSTLPDEPHARRSFLRRSIAIVPAAALAAGGLVPTVGGQAAPTAAATPPPLAYVPTFFHPAEWRFIQAATARLIPSDEIGPGALEAGVGEFIDRQMDAAFGLASLWYTRGPFVPSLPEFGYQDAPAPRDVYRAGIAATDVHCRSSFQGLVFAELDAARQDAVLQALESGALQLPDVNGRAFFAFLLQNTREGYLSDPMHGGNKGALAWAMIGFPGARADYADWVGRPGERYPLPPVSIHGPQG